MKRFAVSLPIIFLISFLNLAPSFSDPTAVPTPNPSPSPSAPAPAATPVDNPSRFYGWLQQGYTFNFANPADKVNFGINFNWLANSYQLNQLYFVDEKTLKESDTANLGYRIDFMLGSDAPFLASNGLWSWVTGYDPSSGFGEEGPSAYRQMNGIGIDTPQFYLDIHDPGFLSKNGVDFRIGKFYTLMGREVYPGKDTDFYSRTYENVIGTPFSHTGILATYHASDTWDIVAGIVRGWDVWVDNNNSPSYHGGFIWNSPDQRYHWTTAWIFGPEQPNNNTNIREEVTSYLTETAGKWEFVAGGNIAHETNAATNPVTGNPQDAYWDGLSTDIFYQMNPTYRLGFRLEWFHDADGTRTAFFGRPGYRASFYDATVGVTIKLASNVRIRPELRWDWSPTAYAFNYQTSKSQFTPASDFIWEF